MKKVFLYRAYKHSNPLVVLYVSSVPIVYKKGDVIVDIYFRRGGEAPPLWTHTHTHTLISGYHGEKKWGGDLNNPMGIGRISIPNK